MKEMKETKKNENMKQIRILLSIIALLMATTTYAGIEPTSGRYIESNTDLSIKVIGGQVTWKRDYRDRQWRFNRSWESLILTHDITTGNVESIQRANDLYRKLDSAGTVFTFGKRAFIRKQTDGTWLWKDRDGNSTSYDANGKTLRMDSLGGAFITLMYNGDNKLSGAKDVHGTQVLWIEYDLISGKISKARDYGNREINYTWQAVNNTTSPVRYKLTNIKDARGYDWQYAYAGTAARDGRVDVISRTDPEGRTMAITYSGSGRASRITNALGHITSYQFDYIASRKEFYLKTSYPGGRVTETFYERDGEVKKRIINNITIITITEDLNTDIEKDTFGRTTTKQYDEFKNLRKTTYPDGTSTSTSYDITNSNILTSTDERGTITKYQYWPNGRLKKMIEALGTSVERSTEYTYDTYGQMLTMTQVGDAVTATAITQYFYDNKGNVTKIIDAELNERQYTSYDSQGNNLIMLDGRGNSWTSSYDAHGNQTSNKNPLNEETTNTYDKVGNLIKITY
ncbi:MAG TPA: RHS repeat protein, partial [Leucothrix sp.]|nr:RHS repeat protein [Leucothrix sp.]